MALPAAQFVAIQMPGQKGKHPTAIVQPLHRTATAPREMSEVLRNLPLTAIINGREQVYNNIAEKFHALARVWSDYNAGRSVTEYQHAAYLQVIGMGRDAVPFLLREIARGNGNWLLALKYITGAVVTNPEMRGDFDAIRRSWNDWGIANGFGDELRQAARDNR